VIKLRFTTCPEVVYSPTLEWSKRRERDKQMITGYGDAPGTQKTVHEPS
jgi:hypothetical protein